MGKRIIPQRRGRGSPTYEAKHGGIKARYVKLNEAQWKGVLAGQVVDLMKESGRDTILMKTVFSDGQSSWTIAPESVFVGQALLYGHDASVSVGNCLFLSDIPEGSPVCNVELIAGDGGKLVRSTGGYAILVAKDAKTALLKLPSGKSVKVGLSCRSPTIAGITTVSLQCVRIGRGSRPCAIVLRTIFPCT